MNIDPPAENIVLPFRKARTAPPDRPAERPLRGFSWMPDPARKHFIAMLGEFVGTFLFLFFAFAATQVANSLVDESGMTSVLLYISLAFAFSLAVNVWVFFRISGGLFNPAVSLGLALVGAVSWLRAILTVISQILGSIVAAAVVSALFPGDLAVRTRLGVNTSIARGLFIEMFLTAELIFTIFMLAAEKHRGTFLAPIGIGLALFIAELAGVLFTGGSLNPARSFGPDVVLHTFDSYHWIYWVGPGLGAILAALFYHFIKMLEYETANAPGADSDGSTDPLTAGAAAAVSPVDYRPTSSGPIGSSSVGATSLAAAAASRPRYAGPPATITGRHDGTGEEEEEESLDGYCAGPEAECGSIVTRML